MRGPRQPALTAWRRHRRALGRLLTVARQRPRYGQRMNRTERALEAVSKAVREATSAFEREMLEVKVDDLPTPVIRKLSAATDALAAVLVETEGFRGHR